MNINIKSDIIKLQNGSTSRTVVDSKRIHKLKFYADQPLFGTENKLFEFVVADEFSAIRLIVKFHIKDPNTNIRAAWLTPNENGLSKKISVPFKYKEFELYKQLMSEIK